MNFGKKITSLLMAGAFLFGIGCVDGLTAVAGQGTVIQDQANVISKEEAKKIALQKAEGGTVVELESDYQEGRMNYEVDVVNGATKYDFEIDAATGTIVKYEQKAVYRNKNFSNLVPAISADQATEFALQKARGGVIVECELEVERGQLVYDITVVNGNQKIDFDISAADGTIIKYKQKTISL